MATLFELPGAVQAARHPAKYTDALLPVFVRMLRDWESAYILDPFGGTGKIFSLQLWIPNLRIEAVEIEPKWCALHPWTTLGSALELPWADNYFDAIVTSPTYGNRMADHHEAKDGSLRNTYRHSLGEPLKPGNSGELQWGDEYREFHVKAWKEARRVLIPGGIFILNIKDHVRRGCRQYVTDWHISALQALGFEMIEHEHVETPGNRHGENSKIRIPYESVVLFRG